MPDISQKFLNGARLMSLGLEGLGLSQVSRGILFSVSVSLYLNNEKIFLRTFEKLPPETIKELFSDHSIYMIFELKDIKMEHYSPQPSGSSLLSSQCEIPSQKFSLEIHFVPSQRN